MKSLQNTEIILIFSIATVAVFFISSPVYFPLVFLLGYTTGVYRKELLQSLKEITRKNKKVKSTDFNPPI